MAFAHLVVPHVTQLSELPVAGRALVRLQSIVHKQVVLQSAHLREGLATVAELAQEQLSNAALAVPQHQLVVLLVTQHLVDYVALVVGQIRGQETDVVWVLLHQGLIYDALAQKFPRSLLLVELEASGGLNGLYVRLEQRRIGVKIKLEIFSPQILDVAKQENRMSVVRIDLEQ